MPDARLVSVHLGQIAPLGPKGVPSGFVKHAADGPVAVGELGLAGDQQADLRVHGGPEKAVYGYALSHYERWAADFPEHAAKFVPGSMGENLSIDGLAEDTICIGDMHRIGSALLQVCQPRQPCFKFALRFDDSKMPRAMMQNGRSGWYYRVVEPGMLRAGDSVTLEQRPNPDFPFPRLIALITNGAASIEDLSALAEMSGVARQWQAQARFALRQMARE